MFCCQTGVERVATGPRTDAATGGTAQDVIYLEQYVKINVKCVHFNIALKC